jgi:site-specific DNA recombinase
MNRYGKRCVLYPRVSTEMQVDGYSLEGQKNMLTRFADREEMIVVDTYEDAGKSGKSIEGRPAFQKMLRDIEDGLDIDYILVYKLSRFGRNAADILNSLELVQSYGVNLICIEEGIDSSQTSGKLLISVLSAVAEIERENIIEQTMNGRREKARQGGWNGGFAPYGYTLEDNKLMIEETEAVAIRKIFELYTSSEIGLGGIANQLNLQGIRKIPRQNGTLEDWTGHFIKLILDNPVYCGKIAYGRRTKEKVKGTKNDYQMKRNDDYILTEGQHKGIVSEEVWEKAHAKRLRTGVKQPSKIGRDRVHLLSGLLKCPVCGSPMYTNKHAWTNKDGTYKEIYYYVCSRNRMVRGKHCEYKAMLKKTDIEPMVIEAIREIVRNEEYAQAIKKRIGVQIDTKAVDKELEGYQAKLKEVDLNKTRLEREIDSLPADAKYRERKLHDMTLRLDSLYDVIVELEEKIEDARLRRDAIKQQAITLENIYKIMVNFDCVYNIINDEEKRNVVTALIKEIEIYRNDESEYPLKRIGLNFPVFKDGGEVTELLWDKGNTVETVTLLGFTSKWWHVQIREYTGFVAADGLVLDQRTGNYYDGYATAQVHNPISTDRLNLRAEKTANSASLGKYYNGCTVAIVQKGNDGWSRVRIGNLEGYMKNQFLDFNAPKDQQTELLPKVTIQNPNGQGANLRRQASTRVNAVALYPNGTQVRVLGIAGEWCHVLIDGEIGFMMTQYLVPRLSFESTR